jgi:hypothetical protein
LAQPPHPLDGVSPIVSLDCIRIKAQHNKPVANNAASFNVSPSPKKLQPSPTLWPLLKYCVLHLQSLSRQSIEFFLSSQVLNEFVRFIVFSTCEIPLLRL